MANSLEKWGVRSVAAPTMTSSSPSALAAAGGEIPWGGPVSTFAWATSTAGGYSGADGDPELRAAFQASSMPDGVSANADPRVGAPGDSLTDRLLENLAKSREKQTEATLRMARIQEKEAEEARLAKSSKLGTRASITKEDELTLFAMRLCDDAKVPILETHIGTDFVDTGRQ